MDSVLDKSVMYAPIDVIRNRIFDGDSFAFMIVLRVVRVRSIQLDVWLTMMTVMDVIFS